MTQSITITITVRNLPNVYYHDFVNVLSNNAFNSGVPIRFDCIGRYRINRQYHKSINDIQVSIRTDQKLNIKRHIQKMIDHYNKHIQESHNHMFYDEITVEV